MPPERRPADNAGEWLNRAESDLKLAEACPEGVYLEDLCFHAQQAAEKAMKAVFVHKGWPFPYVHDLSALVTGLMNCGLAVPDAIKQCVTLTEFAVENRYPGWDAPITEDEYNDSLGKARTVVHWARGIVFS